MLAALLASQTAAKPLRLSVCLTGEGPSGPHTADLCHLSPPPGGPWAPGLAAGGPPGSTHRQLGEVVIYAGARGRQGHAVAAAWTPARPPSEEKTPVSNGREKLLIHADETTAKS